MKRENPLISIILPSYNVKNYVKQCIESVMNQTLTDIEIICVDAGSDDGTLDILKEYAQEDERVNVYLSNKKSYGSQVNQGISLAKGDYISIVETDDYIKENMMESLYDLTQYSTVDVVKGNFYHVYDNGEKLELDRAKRKLQTDKTFTLGQHPIFLEGHPSIWAAIYRRKFLQNNSIKFLEEEGGAWVDNPFFIETAIKAQTIVYTDAPYYYYREDNIKSSSNDLTDLSIPLKRISEMFDVLDQSEYKDNVTIREMLYRRLSRYVEIIMENEDDYTNYDYDTCKSFNRALQNIDKNYVRKKFSNEQKKLYYKLASPLILVRFKMDNLN